MSRRRRSSSPTPSGPPSALVESLRAAIDNYELAERRIVDQARLSESASDLERRLYDPGWRRFTVETEAEFTDEGRRQMRAVCRLIATANPLVKRGLALRSAYVHSSGVDVTARANGSKKGEQDVHAVVSAFWDDPGNVRALTGGAARERLERTLGTDGEFFVALFTRPTTGDVQARIVLADEITEIITNPEDRSEPRYYKRCWIEQHHQADGSQVQKRQERLYPALDYRPKRKPRQFAGLDVAWDSPMLQCDVNRPEHWQRGVPDAYAAINWARAYKVYLEEWAALMSALSRFAWKASAKTPTQAAALRARTSVIPRDPATGEGAVGGTAMMPDGANFEPISKSGATIDAESGRPLAMMVAAALGVPVTMLLADPGQTGARATAETLDTPTELEMGSRRSVWTDLIRRICRWVVASSVRAPQGKLRGKIIHDSWGDTERVELRGNTDDTIDITWPDLDETSVKEAVDAIVAAHSTGIVPEEQILRLLLAALGLKDPESIVAAVMEAKAAAAQAQNDSGAPDAPVDTTVDGAAAETGTDMAGAAPLPAGMPAGPVDNAADAGGDAAARLVADAAAKNWSQLDADIEALKAAEADAAPAAVLPDHWADTAAVDEDWRIEAAIARGADIAQAYGSQDAAGDVLLRGFDLTTADAALTGAAAPSLEEFTAAAEAAKNFQPTVQIDNRLVAVAMRVGMHAGIVGQPASTCPYRGGDPEQTALRRMWLLGYLRVRPAVAAPSPQTPVGAERPESQKRGAADEAAGDA